MVLISVCFISGIIVGIVSCTILARQIEKELFSRFWA